MAKKNQKNTLEDPINKLSGMNTYLEGKMKCYSLMFAVNGGSFAIAKFMVEDNTQQILRRPQII